MKLDNFVDDLSSSLPAPGGGSASALFGVLGSALASMVCALTKGRQAYKQYESFVSSQHEEILKLQNELNLMMDKDVEAFMKISEAYKLPKDTDDDKIKRSEAIQAALIPATEIPMKIMQLSAKGLDITNTLIGKTNKQAISDIGCAVLGFKAGLQGAYLNVRINLSSSKNDTSIISQKTKDLFNKYSELADNIYNQVLNSL